MTCSASWARFLAAICSDPSLPWPTGAGTGARKAALEHAIAALPAGATGSFGSWAALSGDAATCLYWPGNPRGAGALVSLPDNPVLILSGELDARTPHGEAASVARMFPRGRLVVAPGVGHGVISGWLANDPRGSSALCREALVGWASAGRPSRRCMAGPPLVMPLAAEARSVVALPPLAGTSGIVGQVLTGVVQTLLDVRNALNVGGPGVETAVAGIDGGIASGKGSAFRLSRYSIVPGLWLSGELSTTEDIGPSPPFGGRIVVSRPNGIRGTLHVDDLDSGLVGVVGGRRVRIPLTFGAA